MAYNTVGEAATVYEYVFRSWSSIQYVDILTEDDSLLARFPLTFLEACGDNSWSYISVVIHHLVNEEGILSKSDGTRVDPQGSPEHGNYVFRCINHSDEGSTALAGLAPAEMACAKRMTTFRKGPEMKHRHRAPRSGGSSETMSNSKRSTKNQVGLPPDSSGLLAFSRFTCFTE